MSLRKHRRKLKKICRDLTAHIEYIEQHRETYPDDCRELHHHLACANVCASESTRFINEHWYEIQFQLKERIDAN